MFINSHLPVFVLLILFSSDVPSFSCGKKLLTLSMFRISRLHHIAVHYYALILNLLYICLMVSSVLVSKLTSSPSLFLS